MFIGLQSPGKPRPINKSNTVSSATSKPLTSGGSVGRRSTISYEAKAASNEKTNLTADSPRYVIQLQQHLSALSTEQSVTANKQATTCIVQTVVACLCILFYSRNSHICHDRISHTYPHVCNVSQYINRNLSDFISLAVHEKVWNFQLTSFIRFVCNLECKKIYILVFGHVINLVSFLFD